jgi:DNA-binding SARP family transcriptional activator
MGDAARARRDPSVQAYARQLARRLAAPVKVFDLGRVRIRVGERVIEGSQVRRKVLSLLCFLLTKPGFSASREDVTENLWPDLDPNDALNSLNQTVYFLRRVFEPAFREAISPGYVHQDGETIWLDTELVGAESLECGRLITSFDRAASVRQASSVLSIYSAPFALDFMYEDWAANYRDPLHASVLRVAEHAIRGATDRSEFNDGIALAERVLRLEPEADEVQLALIHFYRLTGAHAAAAEQYGRYAKSLRSLGVDPPPLSDLDAERW